MVVGHTTTIAQNQIFEIDQTLPIHAVPQEVLISIFSFLQRKDVVHCSLVSRKWREICSDEQLLKFRYSENVADDFTPLVEKKFMTWKDVGQYIRFSSFLSGISQEEHKTHSFIRKENPQLSSVNLICNVSRPFVKYGSWTCSIWNSTSIKIFKDSKGEGKIYSLGSIQITELFIDKDHLFVLRIDDVIIWIPYQSLYMGGEEQATNMREIPTAKKKLSASTSLPVINHIIVQNGYIILKYASVDTLKIKMEVINYLLEKTIEIKDPDMEYAMPKIVKDNRLYARDMQSVFVWNLVTNKKESIIRLVRSQKESVYSSINLDGNTLYTDDSEKQLSVISLEKGNTIKHTILPLPNFARQSAMVGHLFFGYYYERDNTDGERKIAVINRVSNKIIKIIDVPKDRTLPANHASHLIEQLVTVVRENVNCVEPQSTVSMSDQLFRSLSGCLRRLFSCLYPVE